jgi:hypothetical protein
LVIRRKSSYTSHEQSLFDLACTTFPFYLLSPASSHVAFFACHHFAIILQPAQFWTPCQAITLSSHNISPFSGTSLCIGGKNIYFYGTLATLLLTISSNIPAPSITTPARVEGTFPSARFHLYSRDIYLVVYRRH